MAHWFDELTRRLAGGELTRREALRGLGVAAGAALATGLPTAALADEGKNKGKKDRDDDDRDDDDEDDDRGNSDCAHFCQQLPPSQRGRCVSDAAHGRGLCHQCGPRKPAGSASQLCRGTCVTCSGGQIPDPTTPNCTCVCPAGTTFCTPINGPPRCVRTCAPGLFFDLNCACYPQF
jgi:hypothetical protein